MDFVLSLVAIEAVSLHQLFTRLNRLQHGSVVEFILVDTRVFDNEIAHPRRKSFIKPQLIPVVESDKIPHPLVHQLMSYKLLKAETRRESDIASGLQLQVEYSHQTPVLHSSVIEEWQTDEVKLVKRILNFEHIFNDRKKLSNIVDSKFSSRHFTNSGVYSHRLTTNGFFKEFKIADDEPKHQRRNGGCRLKLENVHFQHRYRRQRNQRCNRHHLESSQSSHFQSDGSLDVQLLDQGEYQLGGVRLEVSGNDVVV